jgi:hypothetical protein
MYCCCDDVGCNACIMGLSMLPVAIVGFIGYIMGVLYVHGCAVGAIVGYIVCIMGFCMC